MSLNIGEHEVEEGIWALDPSHSEIGFTVRHAGISKVRGRFTDFDAQVKADEDFDNLSVNAVIKTASFDSGDTNRDQHVRSADFFDVESYPTITFDSTKVKDLGDGDLEIIGNLTIRGVTQEVVLRTEFNGVAVDPFGATRAGISASTVISRKAFGLTWNAALEAGGVLVGDKVTIDLELSFIKN